MSESLNPAPPETIATMVHWIRHENVMLDSDLAELYGVEIGALNRAVKRNLNRFPDDFLFQLTAEEMDALRCQTGILKNETVSENRSQPVTGSERAVEVNIAIMRTFVQLRRLMDSNRDLAQKIGEMEEKYDGQFRIVFDAIRQLMTPPAKPSRELGFHIIQPPKPVKKPTRSPRKS